MSARVFDSVGRAKVREVLSAEEFSFWTARAALLDPAAMVYNNGTLAGGNSAKLLDVADNETYYLLQAWQTRIGPGPAMTTADLFLRNPQDAPRLTQGTTLYGNGWAGVPHVYYCRPSLVSNGVKYADPKGLYFERLKRLEALNIYMSSCAVAAGAANATLVTQLFPSDFASGMVVSASYQDVSWVALGAGGTRLIAILDEVSDDHQYRSARGMMVPFSTATFDGITIRNGNVAGTVSVGLAGTGSVLYHKLPTDW
jgi:hypothetical protein